MKVSPGFFGRPSAGQLGCARIKPFIVHLKSAVHFRLCLLFAAANLLLPSYTSAEVPSAIAIKDVRVITGSGTDLPKATVLLRHGLIEDVGTGLPIPADAWIIDGAGLTVYPGFIDGLSTWGIPAAAPPPTPPRTGAPAAQPPPAPVPVPRSHGPEDRPQTYSFDRAADLVSPSDTRLEAARAAGFTSAATFPNKGIVEGLGAMIDLAGERGRDMVVAQPIGQQIVFRVGGFASRTGYPASLMGNIAYVRQLYLDLDHSREANKLYAAHPTGLPRPEYDHSLEGLAASQRLLLPADESQQITRALALGAEWKTPFLLYGLHEGFKCLDELKEANVPLLISLKWPEKPKDANPADIPNYRDLVIREQAPALPGMLAKAGVKFGFFSDGLVTAPELKKAIKKAVDNGLSRSDAVRALSLSIAEMYGISDRMGSVDKGKIANVVVTKGDIFDEKSEIQYVFIDGKEFRPTKEVQEGTPGHVPPPPTDNLDDTTDGRLAH